MSLIITKGKNKTHKLCRACSELKPIKEFNRNVTNYDGLISRCKKCRQRYALATGGIRYNALRKRPFPSDGRCEICNVELSQYCYHHWDDNNLNLGIWLCGNCDFLVEGLDEIEKNSWKVDIYRRLKKEVEEAEKDYVYSGPYSPSDGIRRLFLNGEQTYKWCSHCARMRPIVKFGKQCSSYDGLQTWCKECKLSYTTGYQGKRFSGLHKRPKPDRCELCNGKVFLIYHHWDDNNRSNGVWVCHTNKCHHLIEAVDRLKNGSLSPTKYYELKQRIVLAS